MNAIPRCLPDTSAPSGGCSNRPRLGSSAAQASPSRIGHYLNVLSGYWARSSIRKGKIQVTNSASSLMAIVFGLAVFAVIIAVGWRSVQNRRILRLRGADGQETIIVAGEDDDFSSVATTTESN